MLKHVATVLRPPRADPADPVGVIASWARERGVAWRRAIRSERDAIASGMSVLDPRPTGVQGSRRSSPDLTGAFLDTSPIPTAALRAAVKARKMLHIGRVRDQADQRERARLRVLPHFNGALRGRLCGQWLMTARGWRLRWWIGDPCGACRSGLRLDDIWSAVPLRRHRSAVLRAGDRQRSLRSSRRAYPYR